MNPDDLSDVRLDRDPDDLLPEDWDEVADGEIADLTRRVIAESPEYA
ncbi:hypothetical protein [Methylobacterium sp. P1-11]|nr:hypothetical protein [Methylobacterium sp. P1-11]